MKKLKNNQGYWRLEIALDASKPPVTSGNVEDIVLYLQDKTTCKYHLNAGGGSGVEVLYYGEATKKLASDVSAAISKALGVKDRGAKQRKDLYFLRKVSSHAILIEVCFIDSLIDMQKLLKKRSAVAEAVADVLLGPIEPSTEKSTSSTGQSAYKGSSLVDYLKSIKVDSSFANRARLAVTYGIVRTSTQYKGSAEQNTALLKAIRGDSQ